MLKRRFTYIFSVVLSLMVLLVACTERYDFPLDSTEPRLVITGYLSTEPGAHAITITKSGSYFGTDSLTDVPPATVKINGMELTPNPAAANQYLTDSTFAAVVGETYNLEVSIDFDGDGKPETYTSSATTPEFVKLDSITLETTSLTEGSKSLFPLSVIIYFQDPPGSPDYLGTFLYLTTMRDSADTYHKYRISNTASKYATNSFDPAVTDGKYIFTPSHTLGRRNYLTPLDTIEVFPYDTVEIELNNFSKDYYKFICNCSDATVGANPLFTTPAGALACNITGGALGSFGVCTSSRASAVVPYKENTWPAKDMTLRFGYKWRELFPKQD